jgi:hypothetical protein
MTIDGRNASGEADRRTIFQSHWWLEAVTRGQWNEVTVRSNARVIGALPYVVQKRAGFTVLGMPPLVHTMGPCIDPGGGKPRSRQSKFTAILDELLAQLPRSHGFHQRLDPSVGNPLAFLDRGYRIGVQPTIRIGSGSTIEEIWRGMKDKTRNAIRRSQECLEVIECKDPEWLSHFYKANIALSGRQMNVDLSVLRDAYSAALSRDRVQILVCQNSQGPVAAIMLVWDKQYAYYILGTRSPHVPLSGAQSLLLWEAIRITRMRALGLDFDGIANAATGKFLMGFGGEVSLRLVAMREVPSFGIYCALASFLKSVSWNDRTTYRDTWPGSPAPRR